MTKLEIMKLNYYRRLLGQMSSKEALEIALDSEQFRRNIGEFDPAGRHFAHKQLEFLNYAELLEKAENFKREDEDADRLGCF